MLTNLDLVVYRLRYYFIDVLNSLKYFMTKLKHSLNPKTLKIYFCITFIVCRLGKKKKKKKKKLCLL